MTKGRPNKDKNERGQYMKRTTCTDIQYKVLMDIVYTDMKTMQILEKHNVPSSTYYDWYRQKCFTDALEEERKSMRRNLKNKAWKKLEKCLEDASSRDADKYIKMILGDDESKYYLTKNVDTDENTHANIVISIKKADNPLQEVMDSNDNE